MIHTESHSGEREWVESERETSVPGWAWCQAGHTERIPLLRSGLWQFSWLRSRYWRRGHFPSLFRIGQCHAAEFSPFITCNSFVNIDNLNNETSRHCGVLTVSGRWNVGLGASTVAQASAGKVWGPPQEGAGILCGVQCLRPLSHELILQLLLVVYHLLRVREKYSNYVCCILFSFICVAYEYCSWEFSCVLLINLSDTALKRRILVQPCLKVSSLCDTVHQCQEQPLTMGSISNHVHIQYWPHCINYHIDNNNNNILRHCKNHGGVVVSI